jgi:hypothetical protein
VGLELGLKVAKKRCYCLLSRAKRLQSRLLNDALVKSESGHVFLFKTAKDDNKDPKIQDPKIQRSKKETTTTHVSVSLSIFIISRQKIPIARKLTSN